MSSTNLIEKKNSYLGNQLLKKSGVQRQWTEYEISEVIKCKQDPIYFIETYCKLVVLGKGLTNVKLYPLQKEIIRTCLDNRFVCVLAARQSSKSSTIAALILYLAQFNSNYTSAILANKASTSREILDRIKTMFLYLPEFLKIGTEVWNKGDVKFSNGSIVFAAATSKDSIRGKSADLVLCDEYGFVNNADEFYESTFPVISSSTTTKFIITSTPNGMNHFYKIYIESVRGINDYVSLKYIWSDVPGRDEEWKNKMLRTVSKKQFAQEFECIFAGSSSTLISGEKLETLTHNIPLEEKDNFKIYKYPIQDRIYVSIVDVSEGIGKDYSVILIIDITEEPFEVVFVYRSNIIPPLDFTKIIYEFANKYNESYLLIENNNIGSLITSSLFDNYEYSNIVSDYTTSNFRIGVRTTTKTKSIGCSTLKSIIENDLLIINDFDLLTEIFSFVKKGRSFQAEDSSKHDDIVMCLVLFAWFTQENYFSQLTDTNIKSLIHDVKKNDEELYDFGLIVSNTEENETFYGNLNLFGY